MFGMGMGELIIVAIVALLALGPDRLPGAAKKVGKTIRDLRKQTTQLKETIEQDSQLGDAMKEIKDAFRDDPLRDPPPKRRPPSSEPKTDETETDQTDTDQTDTVSAEAETDAETADGETESAGDETESTGDDTDVVPVEEPRKINMSEFQKYVHMWGPQAAAEKYGTSLQEAEAAIDAVVGQAAAAKRNADG